LGGSPLGGLTSGWLATRIGSAPLMLVVNGTMLTLVALYFLIHGHTLKDIWSSQGDIMDTLRTDGRPTAQWPRLKAGRSDDLGTPR